MAAKPIVVKNAALTSVSTALFICVIVHSANGNPLAVLTGSLFSVYSAPYN